MAVELESTVKLIPSAGRYEDLEYDNEYIVDKLYDVYLSGSIHDEHQPSHLVVSPPDPDHCVTKCREEYGNPCERFVLHRYTTL